MMYLNNEHIFQRNHSLFGNVWSSMKRGRSFSRAKSLKANSTQIKIIPASSIDLLPHNSLQRAVTEGMNHITSMTKNVVQNKFTSANSLQSYKDEEIPLHSLSNTYNRKDVDGDSYQVIE